ncbi:MAG: N-acetylmuramoyl-L-alanine amidase [Pseudomonadota bacterium]
MRLAVAALDTVLTPIDRASPNHDARAPGTPIDVLVLHYTGMPTGEAALARLLDPAAKVSAHYLVEEDGRIFRLVAEDRRAWHAGQSSWRGLRDINGRSIGIELVNPGHEFGYRDFSRAQYAAVIELAGDILRRHPIPPRNMVGHADIAPLRKTDPGERFDWEELARAGIGLWPFGVAQRRRVMHDFGPGERDEAVADIQARLAEFGYEVPPSGVLDDATGRVLAAFQRHFRPARVDGRLDGETSARLTALLRLCGP